MGDANPIRTLGDYSRPSHEGHRNTIELPEGNNVVPLRSDTIRLVQNGCLFHRLRSEDPNQHLKDFLKLVDLLDLDVANRERTSLCLFQFSLRDQASYWLERIPARSISTWEDLTTHFLAQFFPPGRTTKLYNDILMFQQHQGESLSEALTRFKDLLQKVHHHGIDLWLQNDPKDFAKPVKAISLPQDVPSTSDRHLIELENQVQCLMEAHLAPKQRIRVNKITSSCEICSGPHDTYPNHAPMYNAILDKYVEGLELGKNGSTFIQGEMPKKIEDPGLFTLPCRLGNSEPFDTLADLGDCVNIIPLYLFKKLNIRLLEETNHVFRLADGTKSYPIRIVRDVEVHIGILKLLTDFYVIDMKNDLKTPLQVGRVFLATTNAVIDCRKAKIMVGEGITSDDEESNHEDASDTGAAPKQQQQVIPQTTAISNIKLPILKKEEYDIWAMEMEHYLEYIETFLLNLKIIEKASSKNMCKDDGGFSCDSSLRGDCGLDIGVGSIPINRGLIQAIPTSLPPQPIREATKASNLQRIPPEV
ncbi:MAK10-like protein [Tanacetum coccineum]